MVTDAFRFDFARSVSCRGKIRAAFSENALLMNRWDCELARDGQKWRFKRVTIDNAWMQGDPEILNALATQRVLRAKSKPK
jgi:hypothetical protein